MSCLGNDPKGKDYEDYVAAHFQSTGRYYVEKNIEEKGKGVTILELDIIATDYSNATPNSQLIEVKSGGQDEDKGFKCLFKVKGWMDYLGLTEGQYISKRKIDNIEKFIEVGQKLEIKVFCPENSENFADQFISPGNALDKTDIEAWVCAYQTERKMIEHLQKEKQDHNSHKKTNLYVNRLLEYYFQVNNDIFFLGDNIDRINSLFKTYTEFGHISAKVGNILCRGSSSDNVKDIPTKIIPKKIYKQTYYDCEYTDINVSTYIENRARLAILKNAVDYVLLGGANSQATLDPEFQQRTNRLKNQTSLDNLKKYPIFWQWFLWVFGGFILEGKDYEDQEFELLSEKTGIPVAEIHNALKAYDILFPQKNGKGWLQPATRKRNVKLLSVFSVPFMGIGVKYRQHLYKNNDNVLKVLRENKDLKKWARLSDKVLNEM